MNCYGLFREAVLFLLVGMAAAACYEPVDFETKIDARIPCVHCILNSADTQYLSLHYLSGTDSDSNEAIDGAEVILQGWDRITQAYQRQGQFQNVGDGTYILAGEIGSDSTWRLVIRLPEGDTLQAVTHIATMKVRELFRPMSEALTTQLTLHGRNYVFVDPSGDYYDISRLSFCVISGCPIWIHKMGWSPEQEEWYPEYELTSNFEDRTDAFNKTFRDFMVATVPEAMTKYPSVQGKPLHYRYLRFPAGSLQATDTLEISGDFSGVHYGVIGAFLKSIRSFHQAEITFDKIAGIPHNTAECAWLFNDRVGYVNIKAVSSELDHYLKDVAEYEFLQEVSNDVIGIYRNTNHYTNIQGGTGIFGAEVNSQLYWTCGVWNN